MSYNNFYHERLLEHFHRSLYKGIIKNPTFSIGINNLSCGDSVVIQGRIVDGVLVECRFQAEGCIISGAAASLLAQNAEGLKVDEIKIFTPQTMLELIGLSLGPTRLRCALLALEALQGGIHAQP